MNAETNKMTATDESAVERDARVARALAEVAAISRKAELADNPPAKFSLLEMMLAVTLLAVMLGLVRTLGLWGAVVSFVGANLWTLLIYPRWGSPDRARQVAMFDATWGIVLPLLCFACDPFVFKDHEQLPLPTGTSSSITWSQPRFYRGAVAVYALVAWQMLSLLIWMAGRGWLRRFAGFFLGTWALGVIFAGGVGLLLVVPAAIFTFVGIGMLGFTPLFTCYVFARRMREAIAVESHQESEHSTAIFWLLAAFGFMLALLGPLQLAGIGDWFLHDTYFRIRQDE